jgi:hypothetical protein
MHNVRRPTVRGGERGGGGGGGGDEGGSIADRDRAGITPRGEDGSRR